MSGHEWEIAVLVAGAILAWYSRRQGDREAEERARQTEYARRVGERIGALEKANDHREGFEAGLRQGREEATRKDDR